jgi:hypothetical protein
VLAGVGAASSTRDDVLDWGPTFAARSLCASAAGVAGFGHRPAYRQDRREKLFQSAAKAIERPTPEIR